MTALSLRRAFAASAVLSLTLALTACGGADDAGDDPAPTLLDDDELTSALVTLADLPDGFVDDPDETDDESGGFEGSCLGEVSTLSDRPEFEADQKVEASYVLDGDAGQSSVRSQVQSYADEEEVITAIEIGRAHV